MFSSSSGSHHRSSLSCLLIRHPQPVLAFQCLLSFYRVLRSPPDIHYLNVDLSVTFSCPLRPTTYYFNVRLPSFSCLLHYQTVTISTFTAWGHFHVFFSNLQRLFRHSSVLIFIYYYVHLSSFSRVIIHNQTVSTFVCRRFPVLYTTQQSQMHFPQPWYGKWGFINYTNIITTPCLFLT